MSSNVLFDASSIGLFHECSSLLKKKKRFSLFYFTLKKKKNRFDFLKLSTNLDLFIYKIDLIFFTYKPKTNFFIFYFTLFKKRSYFFTYKSKTNFFIHKNGS